MGRFAVAAVVAAVFATSACAAASGAERTTPVPAAASMSAPFAPATAVLPRVELGSSVPGAAVEGAIAAARRAMDRAVAAEAPAAEEGRATTSGDDCAERAMAAGRFDPSCAAYQGYLDPGTSAGRGPTSGETQLQYLCEQGLVPRSDC